MRVFIIQYMNGQRSEVTCEACTHETDGRWLVFREEARPEQFVGRVIARVPTVAVRMVYVKDDERVVFDA